jgi:hypothetical protein
MNRTLRWAALAAACFSLHCEAGPTASPVGAWEARARGGEQLVFVFSTNATVNIHGLAQFSGNLFTGTGTWAIVDGALAGSLQQLTPFVSSLVAFSGKATDRSLQLVLKSGSDRLRIKSQPLAPAPDVTGLWLARTGKSEIFIGSPVAISASNALAHVFVAAGSNDVAGVLMVDSVGRSVMTLARAGTTNTEAFVLGLRGKFTDAAARFRGKNQRGTPVSLSLEAAP